MANVIYISAGLPPKGSVTESGNVVYISAGLQTQDIQSTDNLTSTPVTPVSRIVIIEQELRQITIEYESRNVNIESETRTIII